MTAEERKLATLVFADLVGSTAMAGDEDPERVRALLDRFYDAMAAEIGRAEGTVEKFVGDAVMAAFGAPTAHEDDAERALHVGLGMQRRLNELFGDRMALRIGVNTGEVVVGRPREGSSFVTGDTVNVCARLEQAAAPGEILVGERTVSAVRGAFEFGEPRTVEAKGKESGVRCRKLVRPLSLMRPRGLAGGEATFVGREGELTQLQAAFRQAVGLGTTQLVMLAAVAERRDEPDLRALALDAGLGGRERQAVASTDRRVIRARAESRGSRRPHTPTARRRHRPRPPWRPRRRGTGCGAQHGTRAGADTAAPNARRRDAGLRRRARGSLAISRRARCSGGGRGRRQPGHTLSAERDSASPCALAAVYRGDHYEASRLEEKAQSIGMDGWRFWFDPPRIRLALARGDLGELPALVEGAEPDAIEPPSAYLDALVALGESDRIESEASKWLQPGTYAEPFALRALGTGAATGRCSIGPSRASKLLICDGTPSRRDS